MDARKLAAAGMLARGGTQEHVAGLLSPPVSVRTLRRWLKEPAFRAEFERVQANATKPDPEGALYDALLATTNDGIRHDIRVKAAIELRNRPAPGSNGAGPQGGVVHMTVVMYQCEKCGETTLDPPPGFEDEIIEHTPVEAEEHKMLPPSLGIPDGQGNR